MRYYTPEDLRAWLTEERMRPIKKYLRHTLLTVLALVLLGIAAGLNMVSTTVVLTVAILAAFSIVGDSFVLAGTLIYRNVKSAEKAKRGLQEKPKVDRLTLTDEGEIAYYEDDLQFRQQMME